MVAVQDGYLVAAGRRFLILEQRVDDTNFAALSDTWSPDLPHWFRTRRFLIAPGENGWTMSVVWGDATWSSNRDAGIPGGPPFTETPDEVEVGVLPPGPEFRLVPDDDPWSYVDDETLVRLADHVATLPSSGEWEPFED